MIEEQEFGNCPNCNQTTVEQVDGTIFDTYPGAYPTKCKTCGWTGHSEKVSERKAFNESLKQTEADV